MKKLSILITSAFIGLVVGICLIQTSEKLPVYTDQDAYQREYEKINDRYLAGAINSHEASRAFYVNQDHYLSGKYNLESSGWFLIVSVVYLLVGMVAYYWTIKRKRAIHRAWFYFLTLLNIAAVFVLSSLSLYTQQSSGLFPWWADSLGIPIFGALIGLCFVTPLFLAITTCILRKYYREKPSFNLHKFRDLSTAYKIYFLASAAVLLLAIGTSQPVLSSDNAALFAGPLLYNFLLFAGVGNNRGLVNKNAMSIMDEVRILYNRLRKNKT